MENMQPGQVVSPRTDPPSPSQDTPAPASTAATLPPPAPAPEPNTPASQAYLPRADAALPPDSIPPAAEPESFYTSAPPSSAWEAAPTAQQHMAATPHPEALTWTANEFMAHDKNAAWFALLALGGIVIAALVYLLTKDKISTAIVILAAVAFGIFAARKPHAQQYQLASEGLHIGTMFYDFRTFKTFSTSDEGTNMSIVLMPMKRFMPPLTVYVPHEQETAVVNFLADYLPLEQHKADALDNLLRRIRF